METLMAGGFNGLGMGLGNLSRLSKAQTRSISAENFTGEKGKAGMATEGTGANCARDLGRGWKVSPSVVIKPGQTFTLADIAGPGAIQSIWLSGDASLHVNSRHFILRMYWDDQEQPSVESPAPDFFAAGWGGYVPVMSMPVMVGPNRSLCCFWEMPFRKHARITLENLHHENITIYWQINYTLTEVPEDCAYFHAQFRRVNPLPYKDVYTIIDGIKGRGHYVGTYMAWGINNNGWWGEGEIKFFMDGDFPPGSKDAEHGGNAFPTICGTGTEDYFLGCYDFDVNGDLHRPVRRHAPGDEGGRPVQVAASARDVPLAHHGPRAVRERPPRDDPGPGLARRRALPAHAGRHGLGRLLVPDPADGPIPQAAGQGLPRDYLRTKTGIAAKDIHG
jgi:hypothetical protein